MVRRDWLPILLIAVVSYFGLVGLVPLTYDEAANYQLFSSHGYGFVLTDYRYPNNHVLFSLLQSLLLPAAMVDAMPRSLRLLNTVVTAVLILALSRYLQNALAASRTVVGRYRPVLGAAVGLMILFASPLFIVYLFVARGYLLGSVLLLAATAGSIKMPKAAPWLLGTGIALAAWCVPTFAYAAPGIALALFLTDKGSLAVRSGKIILSGGVCSVLVGLLYLPLFPQLLAQSDKWTKILPPGEFTWSHLELATGFGHAWAGVLLLLLTVVTVFLSLRSKGPTPFVRVAVTLTAAVLSFYGVAEVLNVTTVCPTPFMRNGLFIGPFLWLALCLSVLALAKQPLTYGVFGLMFANAGINMTTFYSSFLTGDPNDFPTFAILSPSPFERSWDIFAKPEEQIYCAANAGPLCQIYGPLVARHVTLVNAVPKLPCLHGQLATSDETAIAVVRGDKGFRLCF